MHAGVINSELDATRSNQGSAVELMQPHLEPMLRFVNCFTKDRSESTEIVQDALRSAISDYAVNPHGVYRAACSLLRTRSGFAHEDTPGHAGRLCLLLKDIAGLRYAEIAEVLSIDPGEVRAHIASTRAALLAAV